MQANHILTADLLDILFEGRNKEYGAYELRRSYNTRIRIALSVMLSIVGLFIIGSVLGGGKDNSNSNLQIVDSVQLAQVEIPNEPPPPPPPPPVKLPEPPRFEMKKLTSIVIKPDNEVDEDDKPPINEELEDVKIGTENQKGEEYDGTVEAPPVEAAGKGIIEEPKKATPDEPFMKVEIESRYPKGDAEWYRFLRKNLIYPQEAIDNLVQGTVIVQFVVDTAGKVSRVEAISGPAELHEAAIRVVKKSGDWLPAIQNHRKVPSYKRQPIGFALPEE